MEADFMYSDLIIKEEMHAKRINHVVLYFRSVQGMVLVKLIQWLVGKETVVGKDKWRRSSTDLKV